MTGLPDDGFLFINAHTLALKYEALSRVTAEVYTLKEDGRRETVRQNITLDVALKQFPEVAVTARVVQAVIGAAFENNNIATDLFQFLRIGQETRIFPRDVLHALEALAATEDYEAVLRYINHVMAATPPTPNVFRWVK